MVVGMGTCIVCRGRGGGYLLYVSGSSSRGGGGVTPKVSTRMCGLGFQQPTHCGAC